MAEDKGVMVYCETSGDRLLPIATELLGGGRMLADGMGGKLCAVMLGNGIIGMAEEAIKFGADIVYVVDDPFLADYQADAYVSVMQEVMKQVEPEVLLLGHSSLGRDLAPRLAFRLKAGISMNCIALSMDPESNMLLKTRPVYGGNVHAIEVCETKPSIATVRSKALLALKPDPSRHGEIKTIEAKVDHKATRTRILEKVSGELEGVSLEDADVVVSGGRGIGGPDGFYQLQELAKILNGAVGATRPACDNGWVPSSLQVGLTGKIVAPNLYIAIGLSGAAQHMFGCSGSNTIVAINKDPEANIFRQSHFGVVGDWKKVLPNFMEVVSKLITENS